MTSPDVIEQQKVIEVGVQLCKTPMQTVSVHADAKTCLCFCVLKLYNFKVAETVIWT